MPKHHPLMSGGNVSSSNRILYTPASFARENLIYLQEAGVLKALRVHESSRQNLSSFLFFIVTEGSGTLSIEGVSHELKAGDCAFVNCMQKYSHKSSEDLWQLKWVHFNGFSVPGIYQKYFDRGGKSCFKPQTEQEFQKFSELIQEIISIASSDSYLRDMELCGKLMELLTEIMRNSWNPDNSPRRSAKRSDLHAVRTYLDEHYSEDISLDQLAAVFFINKFYLTHLFKEEYGITVNACLTQIRITNAKKHLRFTDLSLEQIGALCGYHDVNYFIRSFKKAEGLTPGEFRKKWRQ